MGFAIIGVRRALRFTHRLDSPWYFCRQRRCFASAQHRAQISGTEKKRSSSDFQVWEYPASDGSDQRKKGILYSGSLEKDTWKTGDFFTEKRNKQEENSTQDRLKKVSGDVLEYFLPAKYPESVAPGYAKFAGFCFTASIAGSASMVLSTQTLLLAVGVVGSNVQHAGIMAGAFNWVMKDFMGQLGGVFFASQMGKTRAFDADPKRWRMVAAMAMDGATLMEILSPLFPAAFVLPVASVANIGKNIGFLTASASRAALHQAVAVSGNLGDVTAKAGSQSIVASLIGTSLGIGLSSVLAHDTYNFALGFCVLGALHQGCNFLSVQSVQLTYFNRQRLHILLDQYINDGTVMSPADIAREESFFPLVAGDKGTSGWLSVGATSLKDVCPNPSDLQKALFSADGEVNRAWYIVRAMPDNQIHLMFFQHSTGEDMIRGMYHACLMRKQGLEGNSIDAMLAVKELDRNFTNLLQRIQEQGWKTDATSTAIEDSHARRLVWESYR